MTLSEPPVSVILISQHPDPPRGRPTLTTAERRTIHDLRSESPHPLAVSARAVLDECDDLATDDGVAGLLFAEIAYTTARRQDLGVDR